MNAAKGYMAPGVLLEQGIVQGDTPGSAGEPCAAFCSVPCVFAVCAEVRCRAIACVYCLCAWVRCVVCVGRAGKHH